VNRWNIDAWLKRLWLINGIALLGILLFGLGVVAVQFLSNRRGTRDVAVAALATAGGPAHAPDRIRAVRFDIPTSIRGTQTRIALIRNGADFAPPSYAPVGSSDYSASQGQEGPIVNVVFLAGDRSAGRLLLDRPAFISNVSYPGQRYAEDSLAIWITYQIALDDTNKDGKLDAGDAVDLYVSDLEGRNFRRVLPQGWRNIEYSSRHDGRTLDLTALEPPKSGVEFDEKRAVQRAFVYDVPAGRLESFAALESLTTQAARLLGAARSVRR
jgi:hypothetical protein